MSDSLANQLRPSVRGGQKKHARKVEIGEIEAIRVFFEIFLKFFKKTDFFLEHPAK